MRTTFLALALLVACTRVEDSADPSPRPTASACFADDYVAELDLGPDYDQFQPEVGRHCAGTAHQSIEGVERIVFLGDSVMVGTPPTPPEAYVRSLLADELAERFGLAPPEWSWKEPWADERDPEEVQSGDVATCARFGARTDDLLRDGDMLERCFPEDSRSLRQLVVLTIGGNDIASITSDGLEGIAPEDIWPKTREFVSLFEDAIRWLKDPERFPGGIDVVFANMHEFTDATGNTSVCPLASVAGFGGSWDDPVALEDMVVWANEQYARIAVDTGTDMVFMLESFCGHGWAHDDPEAPCYRGPNTPRWMDQTCIHPNPEGHRALADLVLSVVAGDEED